MKNLFLVLSLILMSGQAFGSLSVKPGDLVFEKTRHSIGIVLSVSPAEEGNVLVHLLRDEYNKLGAAAYPKKTLDQSFTKLNVSQCANSICVGDHVEQKPMNTSGIVALVFEDETALVSPTHVSHKMVGLGIFDTKLLAKVRD